MLFSQTSHSHYDRSQLREVICQIRFSSILSIDTEAPAAFQEAIRQEFPRYKENKDQFPPRMAMVEGKPQMVTPPAITNHTFVSEDNKWKLNLTKDFISLSTVAYDNWEDFAKRLDMVLAQFIKAYNPSIFQRIGLRYLNVFSRKNLGLETEPWRELFTAPYLGILAEEDVTEQNTRQCTINFETALDSTCRCKVHAGPGMLKPQTPNAQPDNEPRFILDFDVYMTGETTPALAAGGLEMLHGHTTRLFEGAITEKLRSALEPND